MSNTQLKEAIGLYLQLSGRTKEELFKRDLYPFLNSIIDGVMATHRVPLERRDYKDLKQNAMLRILRVINSQEVLDRIKNIRGYCFMLAKYGVLDTLKGTNNYEKYIELVDDYQEEL